MAEQSNSEEESYHITWIILHAAKMVHGGKYKLAAFLRGSKAKDVQFISRQSGYGGLLWYNIPTITGLIEQLEAKGLLKREYIPGAPFGYASLELTEAGRKVLEEKTQVPLQIIKKVEPITVRDSEKTTLTMIHTGKSISDIAKERSLAESTIYTHAFRLIVNNYLVASEVIAEEVLNKVAQTVSKFKTFPSVKEVKEALPEISYEEIRCALAGIKKEETS